MGVINRSTCISSKSSSLFISTRGGVRNLGLVLALLPCLKLICTPSYLSSTLEAVLSGVPTFVFASGVGAHPVRTPRTTPLSA